jgi:hypothetical protein
LSKVRKRYIIVYKEGIKMTAGELIGMSPAERSVFYDGVQSFNPVAINSETASIDKTIEAYANSEIPLDDMPDLQKELLAVGIA